MNGKFIFNFPETPWEQELSPRVSIAILALTVLLIYPGAMLAFRISYNCGVLVPMALLVTAILTLVWFSGETRGEIARKLGMRRWEREDFRTVLNGLLATLIVTALLGMIWTALLKRCGIPADGKQDLLRAAGEGGIGHFVVIVISAAILTPIVEEIVFRRVIHALLLPWGKIPALLIGGAIFSGMHFFLPGFLSLWGLGIVFQLSYLKSRNLGVAMTVHALFNLNALLVQRFFQ